MVPTVEFLELLGPRLDPIRSADTNLSVNISITDTNEYFRLTVRRGVLERRFGKHQNPDLKLSMKRKALLEFTARLTPVNTLISNGDIQSSGDISQLLNLIN
jgi:alkyl sulfatase BDS1-like metallo-beta-lactamase superfamily hydrolase